MINQVIVAIDNVMQSDCMPFWEPPSPATQSPYSRHDLPDSSSTDYYWVACPVVSGYLILVPLTGEFL